MQRLPADTPHVGQATEDNCLAVKSLFFIPKWSDKTSGKTVPLWTVSASSVRFGASLWAYSVCICTQEISTYPSTTSHRAWRHGWFWRGHTKDDCSTVRVLIARSRFPASNGVYSAH